MGTYTGQNAVCLLSQAETTFGEVIASPTFSMFGIVQSSDINRSTGTNLVYGLGQKAAQAEYAGAVENSFRVECVAPEKAMLLTALPVGEGIQSFNFVVGEKGKAAKGVGLKWNQLTINIPEEEPLTASFDGIFKSMLVGLTNINGPLVPTNPILWKKTGLVLTVDGEEDEDIMSMEISINNNITRKGTDTTTANQKRTAKFLEDGNQEITGRITTYTKPATATEWNLNLESDYYGCSVGNISVVATFTNECSTLSIPETLVITLGNGVYTSLNESINANELTTYELGLQFRTITIA